MSDLLDDFILIVNMLKIMKLSIMRLMTILLMVRNYVMIVVWNFMSKKSIRKLVAPNEPQFVTVYILLQEEL